MDLPETNHGLESETPHGLRSAVPGTPPAAPPAPAALPPDAPSVAPQYAPPQSQYPAPPPAPQYAPPPAPGYPATPPPPGGVPPAPGMYGALPPDGNTSGYGEGWPVPPSVKGWSWAGFIPYGIFAFANNNSMWGAFGILAQLFGLGLVYAIVIGVMGREVAWKARRFNSLAEFEETMAAWNKWGIIILCAIALLVGLIVILYLTLFIGIFAAVLGDLH